MIAITWCSRSHYFPGACDDKPQVFLKDSERFLSLTGPLKYAELFYVFTAAGVGEVIAQIVEKVVPKGNVIGIIIYAVGMVLFTMIMVMHLHPSPL